MTFIRPEVTRTEWKMTKHEFYTAYHFALQYREWKDMYRSMQGLDAINADGMPHGNTTSDPTASKAEKMAGLKSKIELVESTVKETDEKLFCWLLKAVTNENITYTYLDEVMNIPCGKNTYYDRRRKFYYLLSKKIEVKH